MRLSILLFPHGVCLVFNSLTSHETDYSRRPRAQIVAGRHEAYHFFEIAARRLVKFFKSYDLIREATATLSGIYNPADLDHLRGLVELSAGRYAQAIAYYDAAISKGPESIWSLLDKAECYRHLRDDIQVWNILKLALHQWPDRIDAEWSLFYLDSIQSGQNA